MIPTEDVEILLFKKIARRLYMMNVFITQAEYVEIGNDVRIVMNRNQEGMELLYIDERGKMPEILRGK